MRTPRFPAALAASALAALAVGCGGYSTYVKSDETALGRVVVYRNGIAYFERRAEVSGDSLALRVPHDKVDDFLKSLTVTDARTGKQWPVSFPTQSASQDGMVDMQIQLPSGAHDLVLSYITDAPSWKPSYRVVVEKDGKVSLQGWAIVDNTSGEDWTDVKLGVGSSSALSFRYDLRTVRLVHRETLESQETFAKAPPTGGSTYRENGEDGNVLGELTDGEIPRPVGHPDLTIDVAGADEKTKSGKQGGDGRYWKSELKKTPQQVAEEARIDTLADNLNRRGGTVVIEGYADQSERDAPARSLDRANMLRNQLIQKGVAPARLQVVAKGTVAGRGAGVRLVEQAAAQAGAKNGPDDEGTPIGQSHFESTTPMTVPRGTSAMVSVVHEATNGEVVYLYDAEAERGNAQFAFRSVRLKNPTDSTLESGPVTVYGEGRFIGEGLADVIPPNATAVVPFALDRQVVVSREGSDEERISRLITVQRGVLTAEVQFTKKTKLKITNRLTTAATVLVRHTVRKGWTLAKSPKLYEKLGESHLFEVALGAGETKTIEIDEATPLTKTVDLRSPMGVGLVRVYLETPQTDTRFSEPMKKLLSVYTEMANHEQGIDSLRDQMDEYRERLDELHMQIVSLKAFKAGGTLMKHLQDKMAEISQKLQEATIAVVDHQEKLMLAKIRFQDGVSELTLEAPRAAQNSN